MTSETGPEHDDADPPAPEHLSERSAFLWGYACCCYEMSDANWYRDGRVFAAARRRRPRSRIARRLRALNLERNN